MNITCPYWITAGNIIPQLIRQFYGVHVLFPWEVAEALGLTPHAPNYNTVSVMFIDPHAINKIPPEDRVQFYKCHDVFAEWLADKIDMPTVLLEISPPEHMTPNDRHGHAILRDCIERRIEQLKVCQRIDPIAVMTAIMLHGQYREYPEAFPAMKAFDVIVNVGNSE